MEKRNSLSVVKDVYYALFMREIMTRLFERRFAWFWLFAEPMLFVLTFIVIRTYIIVMDYIAGIDMVLWLITGLVAFFMFRDGLLNGIGAIGSVKALFSYRQLKPIDAIVVRVFTLGVIHTLVMILFILILLGLGYEISPRNLIFSVLAWIGLWGLGLGSGLIVAVLTEFFDGFKKIINVISLPLMLVSGVIVPVQYLPDYAANILLYNPVVHGVEIVRWGLFDNYWILNQVNYFYFTSWVVFVLFLGIILQIQFEARMKAK
jgi:capsular polysaccharide transport system permease protein